MSNTNTNNTNTDQQSLEPQSMLDVLAEGAPAHVKARYEIQRSQGVVNPIVLAQLLSVGADKEVRPQMIYNYLRKGKFTNPQAVGDNNTQKKVIDLGEANTFALGYVSRRVAKEQAAKERIETELRGDSELVES